MFVATVGRLQSFVPRVDPFLFPQRHLDRCLEPRILDHMLFRRCVDIDHSFPCKLAEEGINLLSNRIHFGLFEDLFRPGPSDEVPVQSEELPDTCHATRCSLALVAEVAQEQDMELTHRNMVLLFMMKVKQEMDQLGLRLQ